MNRTILRGAGVGIGVTFLFASAASAHPQFNPRDLPPGETVETVIVVPHGCGGGRDVPTTSIEVAWDDHVSPQPLPADGWEPFVEPGQAWGWTDAGGTTSEVITLPLEIAVDGEVGDQFDLTVRQACDSTGDVSIWGGGDPDFPAVRINLAEELGEAGSDQGDDHSDHGDSTDDAMDDDAMDHDDDAMDDGADHGDDEVGDGEHADGDLAAAEGSGGYDLVTVAVMAVITLGGIGGIVGMARKS